jgi:tetratricopeptide (TPR) repeat protein
MPPSAPARGDRAAAERCFGRARQLAGDGRETVTAGGGAADLGDPRNPDRAATGTPIATRAAALARPPAVGGVRPGDAGGGTPGGRVGEGGSRSAARDAAADAGPTPDDALPALGERLAAAYNDWGTAEARRGDFAEAVRRYQDAERWSPDAPGLMRNMGLAAFQTGDHAEAARALGRAVEADPGDRAARALLAVSLATAGRDAEASEAFAPLGDAALDDPRLAYLWARSLARAGRPDEARGILGRLRTLPLPPEAVAQVNALEREIEAGEVDSPGGGRQAPGGPTNEPHPAPNSGAGPEPPARDQCQ